MKKTTILSQGHTKQLQLRDKLRNMVRSMLQIGKVQLLCEEMMQLGVDMGTLKTRDHEKYDGEKCGPYHRGGKGRTGKHGNIIYMCSET